MQNNDLKLVQPSSFRKDPKNMSVEELDNYLAVKTKNLQNLNISNSSFPQQTTSFSNNNFQTNTKPPSIIQNPFLQSLSSSPKNNSPVKPSYFQYSNSQLNSKAGSDYLKSLQDKIKLLEKENNELKSNFIKVSEMLSNERNSRNKSNKGNNISDKGQDILIQENKKLRDENEEIKKENLLQQEQIKLLEQDKQRHIEQSVQEKDILNNTICTLKSQLESLNSKYLIICNKLQSLNEKYNEILINQQEGISKPQKVNKKLKKKEKIKNISPSPNLLVKKSINRVQNKEKAQLKKIQPKIPITKTTTISTKKKVAKKRNISINVRTNSNTRPVNKSFNNISKSHRASNIPQLRNFSCHKLNCLDSEEKENTESSAKYSNEQVVDNNYSSIDLLVNETKDDCLKSSETELNNINSQILILESNIEQLKINYQNLLPNLNVNLFFIFILIGIK